MVVSFNWYKYSVVFGFLKKGVKTAAIPDGARSGISESVESGYRESECREREPGKAAHGQSKAEENTAERAMRVGTGPGGSTSEEDFFQLADTVKSELKLSIRKSAIKNLGKRELLLSLRRLLKPYTALMEMKAYPFRVAINNVIEQEAEKYCSIHLSRHELLLLWQEMG